MSCAIVFNLPTEAMKETNFKNPVILCDDSQSDWNSDLNSAVN